MEVDRELLEDHPIEMLRASETDPDKGIHHGECLGFLCLECRNVDEDITEIIHEEDCSLAGQTAPTGYANRDELAALQR
jgi:hypothetical protein